MFIDTSAIVAILAQEPDAAKYVEAIAGANRRLTSPLVRLEAVMRLSTIRDVAPIVANAAFDQFLEAADISIVPITDAMSRQAVQAFERYGKGRGHPARLNLADCMSYAAAKACRVPLLFKGDDFTHTDVNEGRQ